MIIMRFTRFILKLRICIRVVLLMYVDIGIVFNIFPSLLSLYTSTHTHTHQSYMPTPTLLIHSTHTLHTHSHTQQSYMTTPTLLIHTLYTHTHTYKYT